MTKTNVTRHEGGFTLLELLLVIGVAALLLIGGIATYRLVSDGNKTTEATRLLLTIRQEAQVIAQQQGGSYDDIEFDSAVNDDASILVISGILRNQQRNPFNGNILVEPSAAPVGLTVTFENISQAACLRMMQAVNNPNEVIEVGTTAATYSAASGDLPITAANAAAACNNPLNEITWVFP